MSEPFAICPISVLLDRRLTFIQTRVLLALRSYWDPEQRHQPVYPRLATLGERCGYAPRTIIKATNALCELGYLRKESGKGHQATRYWILDPDGAPPEVDFDRPEGGSSTSTVVSEPVMPVVSEPVTSAVDCGVRTGDVCGLRTAHVCGLRTGHVHRTDQYNIPVEPTYIGGNDVAPTNESAMPVVSETQPVEHEPFDVEPAPKSKRRWRSVPDGEILTEERLAFANREGLATTDARREWAKFCDHEFRTGKVSVDRTWRNWVRTAVERQGPGKQFKSADEKQRDVFARVRADLGIEGNQ